MPFTESPKHLFQPPKFTSGNNFFDKYNHALIESNSKVNLDVGAIQSFLSFGYITGDRTLLKEVKRQPWLSEVIDNKVILKDIPKHGYYYDNYDVLAETFFNLLLDEAREVIKNYDDIYVLLSGGLDSRIAAGVLKFLYDNGELKSTPKAVSWGLKDSRDIVYAQRIAKDLDFDWIHLPLTPEIVLENIQYTAKELGLLHSPEMLHSMRWFKKLPTKSLVIAGSFGDSIGRAEFSNLHLLQLNYPKAEDKFNLLKTDAQILGKNIVSQDIDELFRRSPNSKKHAHCEHFMQGYRMRGGLCNALSSINGNAKIYQIFTSPKVYEFIWSLHPSFRGNELYERLFDNHFPELSQIPWARTNKSLGQKTVGAVKGLRLHYHDYTKWSKNELRNDLEALVDLDWFNELNLFNIKNLEKLKSNIRTSEIRVGRANDIWFWLAGFRVFTENLQNKNKKLQKVNFLNTPIQITDSMDQLSLFEKVNNTISTKSPLINSALKKMRTHYRLNETKKLKNKFLENFPAVPLNKIFHK